MGTPKDELEGKKCFEVWPGPYCHTDNCSLQRVLSGTQRWGIEKTITVFSHCREQKKSCLVEATPFLDENGKICGIVESIIDISDRKKAESALLESEERFRGIVENASDLIQTVSAHGFILFVNNAWRATLGYTEEEVRKFHFHDICHPDNLEYCLEVFSKVIAGENITKVETVFLTKNGSEIIVEGKVNLQNDSSGMPMAVRGIFRDITVRKTLEKKLQHKCITDELTDTLNRRGFMEMASRYHNLAKRDSLRYSLLYLDLDNMKTINDDLGHKIGDQALIDLATFLKGMFRQSDLVARMGGDEFVVLLASDLHPNGAKSIVGRIEKSAQNFCQQHGRPYMLRISIGAARFVPGEKRTIEDLLAKADHAMYAVKQKRKGIRS